MEATINYLWESSICLILLYGFYKICLSDHTFFGWNRIYLIVMMAMVMIIPLLRFPFFYSAQTAAISSSYSYLLPAFEFDAESKVNLFTLNDLFKLLLGVYMIGVIIQAAKFFYGLAQIFTHIANSEKLYEQGYTIAIRPDFQPSSFLHYIFMPEYNPADPDHRLIVSHEKSHAVMYHSLDLMFFQIIKIILWFHPFIKFLESSLTEVHEFQVDNEITKTCSKNEYATLLLRLIMADREKQLMNNYFNKFQTKKRIIMMGKTESNLKEKSRFLMAIPLLALLVIVFSCEGNEDHELIIDADDSGETVLRASSGEVFDVVENPPMPAGGFDVWNQYLSQNLIYPAQAKREGIEGTVFVSFVVEVDGSIQGVEILRGIGGGCDEEAIRVIRNAPDWEPGTQRDQKVNVKMRVPIRFKLSAA